MIICDNCNHYYTARDRTYTICFSCKNGFITQKYFELRESGNKYTCKMYFEIKGVNNGLQRRY